MTIETRTYPDGTVATGPAPLPKESPVSPKSAVNLVLRAELAIRAWHRKYGEHQPDWLPPANDISWLENADAFLAASLPVRTVAAAQPHDWREGLGYWQCKRCGIVSHSGHEIAACWLAAGEGDQHG